MLTHVIVLLFYKIIWSNRFRQWDGISICLISVDGVDCACQEPYPFNEGIFSIKLNGPGYKYEIGICTIVWVNGPFKAGRHDVTIQIASGDDIIVYCSLEYVSGECRFCAIDK
jgi:hypothetical protein